MFKRTVELRQRTGYRVLAGLLTLALSVNLVLPSGIAYAQLITSTVSAQHTLNLPVPGTMIAQSPAFVPVLLKGMTIDPDDPLKFDFIVDSGNTNFTSEQIKPESEKLVKYFLASMTVPKDDLWVNLSPYESDRIIPEELGKTELGRDMLAQDYILKQFTSSLMYPEKELGEKFWKRIYERAQKEYGTTQIPVNTFNKVWILPEEAMIYEHEQTVYVVGARLKVMLDSDYQAKEYQEKAMPESKISSLNAVSQNDKTESLEMQEEIVREIIIPEIEKEVNEGKNFAPLRQIYYSLILAKWYKETIKNSLLNQVYVDKNLVKGVESGEEAIKDKIYEQYMEAYKKGVFNYIKEDYDRLSNEMIPRKYFSGGLVIGTGELRHVSSPVMDSPNPKYRVSVGIVPDEGKEGGVARLSKVSKTIVQLALAGVLTCTGAGCAGNTYYKVMNSIEEIHAESGSKEQKVMRLVKTFRKGESAQLREAALNELQRMGDSSLEIIFDQIKRGEKADWLDSKDIGVSLGKPTIPYLIRLLNGTNDELHEKYIKISAMRALGDLNATESINKIITELETYIKLDSDLLDGGMLKITAIETLGKLGAKQAKDKLVSILLNDNDHAVQTAAISAIYLIDNTKVVDLLVPVLLNKKYASIHEYMANRAYSANPAIIDVLISMLLNDEYRSTHETIIKILGNTGDYKAVNALKKVEKTYDVQRALKSIYNNSFNLKSSNYSPFSFEEIVGLINDHTLDNNTRINAVKELGKNNDYKTIVALMKSYESVVAEDNRIINSYVDQFNSARDGFEAAKASDLLWHTRDVGPPYKKLEDALFKVVLAQIKSAETDSLINIFSDQNIYYEFRIEAAKALIKKGDKKAVAPTLKVLREVSGFKSYEEALAIRWNSAKLLSSLGWESHEKNITEEALNGLLSSVLRSPKEILSPFVALGKPGMDVLIIKLHSGEIKIDSNFKETIFVLLGKYAIPYLIEELNNTDPGIRKFSVIALEHIGSELAIDPLINTLKNDEDQDVRVQAIKSLEKINIRRAIELLKQTLKNDGSAKVRVKAAQSLGKLKDESVKRFELMTDREMEYYFELVILNEKINKAKLNNARLGSLEYDIRILVENLNKIRVDVYFLFYKELIALFKNHFLIAPIYNTPPDYEKEVRKRYSTVDHSWKKLIFEQLGIMLRNQINDNVIDRLFKELENKKLDEVSAGYIVKALGVTRGGNTIDRFTNMLNELRSGVLVYENPGLKEKMVKWITIELIKMRPESRELLGDEVTPDFYNMEPKKSSSPVKSESDQSSVLSGQTTSDDLGGIDMNNINVNRQGSGVDIQFDPVEMQEIMNMGIEGFFPVIINVTPLPSVLPLLGLESRKEEDFEVSSLN